MKADAAVDVIALLQDRLNALNDLALTLKHVHRNVVGPNFIAVHTSSTPQVDTARLMVNDLAERIATGLGLGRPGRAAVVGRLFDRPGRHERAPGRAGHRLHRNHRGSPGRDRENR
jgi:starvation-inducible DNA-binding protein